MDKRSGSQSPSRLARATRSMVLAGLLAAGSGSLGCSGGGGGGDDATASVSGYVSNQSAAMQSRAPKTLFAKLRDLVSPVGEAHAGRSGIIVTICGDTNPDVEDLDDDDIPECQTVTDGFGFFTVEGDVGGNLTVTFDTGGAVFSRGVFVPRGGAVSLAGVSLHGDGSAPSSATYVFVTGTVIGANCGTVPRTLTLETPDSVTIGISDDAEIITSEGITCAALNESIDSTVLVEGVEGSDGGQVASRITSSASDLTGVAQFRARLEGVNCSVSLRVVRDDGEPVLVNIAGSTYRGVDECDDLSPGQNVRIRGWPRTVGEFAASEVSLQ